MTKKTIRCCQECSKPLPAAMKATARFCGITCKAAFNNRHKTRGSELYELFMILRYDRGLAKKHGVWGQMCRLGEKWHDEDVRAGRKTYRHPETVLTELTEKGSLRIWDAIFYNVAGTRGTRRR